MKRPLRWELKGDTWEGYGGNGDDTSKNVRKLSPTSKQWGYGGDDELWGYSPYNYIYGGSGRDQLFIFRSPLVLGLSGTIEGGAGDDLIEGGAGDDCLKGDADNDTIRGREGNDSCYGGDGNDEIDGGFGKDTVWGGDDDDKCWGLDGNDYIYGGFGGLSAKDTLWGGDGDDFLTANSSATMYGGDGSDVLRGESGGIKTMYGEAGDDNLTLVAPAVGQKLEGSLYGGASADVFSAQASSSLYGGGDNDSFTVWAYRTTAARKFQIEGGDGDDKIVAHMNANNGGKLVVDAGGGDDTISLFGHPAMRVQTDVIFSGGEGKDTFEINWGSDVRAKSAEITFRYVDDRESPFYSPDTINLKRNLIQDEAYYHLNFVMLAGFPDVIHFKMHLIGTHKSNLIGYNSRNQSVFYVTISEEPGVQFSWEITTPPRPPRPPVASTSQYGDDFSYL